MVSVNGDVLSQLKSFEELACWQAGRESRTFVSGLAKEFAEEGKYTLVSQIKRPLRSVTDHIAEGYGRFLCQENIQFCRLSGGSLYETLEHLLIEHEEKYIDNEVLGTGRQLITKTAALLNGHINTLVVQKVRRREIAAKSK